MIAVERVTRIVLLSAAGLTVAVMMVAAAPWSGQKAGELMVSVILLPLFAAWAVGPYFVCNRFMQEAEPNVRWVFGLAAVVAAFPVLWIYIDAMILTPNTDAQAALVFLIFPLYQFAFILAVYYGVRFYSGFAGK